MKVTLSWLGAAALAMAALSSPPAARADQSHVVQTWRTNDGWQTELRQHSDGARVCASAKDFGVPPKFGFSIVRTGEVTLLMLVDEVRMPREPGDLTFTAEGLLMGTFASNIEGPAWATTEAESKKALQMVGRLPPGPVTISVADRRYEAELTGIVDARAQLKACEAAARQ
jgi:hypothetical protein